MGAAGGASRGTSVGFFLQPLRPAGGRAVEGARGNVGGAWGGARDDSVGALRPLARSD